jgi:hypothetical protein
MKLINGFLAGLVSMGLLAIAQIALSPAVEGAATSNILRPGTPAEFGLG